MAIFTQARRRGQMLSNRRNVTGGPKPPIPGQTPPILRPNQMPATPQGPTLIPPAGGTNPQGGLSGLAARLAAGKIPDKFGGYKFGPNGGIVGGPVGMANAGQARRYQQLYNAAQQAGINIVGGGGEGGIYNPNILYAQPGRYVDLRTGLANSPNTGASTDMAHTVSPEALERMRQLSGYDPAQATATAHSAAVGAGPGGTLAQWQLGSDGQYHNMNQPLPPGVELKPPEGATAPKTQDPSMIAEAAHGTPQAALNAGKDPTKHMAYWEDKGWSYNPATDAWTNRNQPTTSGQTPPINMPGTVPGGVTPAATPPQAGAAAPTMPLDPAYIAAQRAAQLQLNSTLQGTYPALEQINAQNNLALARMNTNQGVDTQALMEALSARGALQSSIYGTERGNLATNYMRTGQDLAADVANAQSSVYQQQQGAYNDYYASLIEALLSAGASGMTSEYTPVGSAGGGGGTTGGTTGNTTNRGNYATPMAARRAGENPLSKKSYWKSKGWTYKNGKWVKKGGS